MGIDAKETDPNASYEVLEQIGVGYVLFLSSSSHSLRAPPEQHLRSIAGFTKLHN
jgi:hypothetical protein